MIGNMTNPTFGTIWFFRFAYAVHQQDVVEETRPPDWVASRRRRYWQTTNGLVFRTPQLLVPLWSLGA